MKPGSGPRWWQELEAGRHWTRRQPIQISKGNISDRNPYGRIWTLISTLEESMEGQERSIMPNREHITPSERRSRQLDAPIDLLPEEMLLCIFKILVEYDPLFVGRLLFVSRYWHHIVQGTPSLWSKIVIELQNPGDIVKHNHYVRIALRNSTNLPLDMTIELYRLYTYLIQTGASYGPALEKHKAGLTRLFQEVVGHKGANVVRWRSFRLSIQIKPHGFSGVEETVKAFMKGLEYPTPQLESLFLNMNSAEEFFPRIGGPLRDLRSLRHLMVDAGGKLGHINYVPGKVEVLRLRLWGSTKVMAPFTNLCELSISSIPNGGVTHKDDPVITFPLLECLTLDVWDAWRIDCAIALSQKIRAPMLNTLRLLDDEAYLSVADATAFHHIRALELLSTRSSQVGILDFLGSHLHKYTALNSLTVCPWHLDSVMLSMSSLKDQDRAPVDLDVLYTVVSNREGVAPDLGNAKKILCMWRSPSDYIYRTHTLSRRDAGMPESVTISQ